MAHPKGTTHSDYTREIHGDKVLGDSDRVCADRCARHVMIILLLVGGTEHEDEVLLTKGPYPCSPSSSLANQTEALEQTLAPPSIEASRKFGLGAACSSAHDKKSKKSPPSPPVTTQAPPCGYETDLADRKSTPKTPPINHTLKPTSPRCI